MNYLGQCHHCRKRATASSLKRCDRCKMARYCSVGCHQAAWRDGSHRAACDWWHASLVQAVFALRKGDTQMLKRFPGAVALEGRRDDDQAISLDAMVALLDGALDDRPAERGRQLAAVFFESLSTVLQAVRSVAGRLHVQSEEDAERTLLTWGESRGIRGIQSVRDAWQRVQADPSYVPGPRDQLVKQKLEREQALVQVIRSCNQQLGPSQDMLRRGSAPPASVDPVRTPPFSRRMRPGARPMPMAGAQPAIQNRGIRNWNPSDPPAESMWLLSGQDPGNAFYPAEEEGAIGDMAAMRVEQARRRRMAALRDELAQFRDEAIGMEEVKEQVTALVATLLVYPAENIRSGAYMNVIVYGDPGTGKTAVSRRLSAIYHLLGYAPVSGQLNRTTRSDWVASFEGQTANKARLRVFDLLGQVAVIDEAYNLVTSDRDAYGAEAVAELVNDMDEFRGLISFCLLGYREAMRKQLVASNEGIDSRFPYQWTLEPYSGAELYAIFVRRATERGFELAGDQDRVREMFSGLAASGVFENVNARSAARLLTLYQSLNARVSFFSARRTRQTIVSDTLVEALRQFAEERGYIVYDDGDDDQTSERPVTRSKARARRRQ